MCYIYYIHILSYFLTFSTFTHYIEQDREQQIQKERESERETVCVVNISNNFALNCSSTLNLPPGSENNTQLYERLYVRSS